MLLYWPSHTAGGAYVYLYLFICRVNYNNCAYSRLCASIIPLPILHWWRRGSSIFRQCGAVERVIQ